MIDSLKENNSIDWVMLDSSEKAVDGVKSGAYYAAVVLSDDFSRNMYHGFMDGLKQPTITYYENEKKNAVAAKITDTAVSTLKNSIDQMYVEIVVSTLFEDADKVEERVNGSDTESGSDSDTPKLINTFSDRIDDVNENIKSLVNNFTDIVSLPLLSISSVKSPFTHPTNIVLTHIINNVNIFFILHHLYLSILYLL